MRMSTMAGIIEEKDPEALIRNGAIPASDMNQQRASETDDSHFNDNVNG